MELSAVTKIVELTEQQEVNKYLELGWKILHIYSTSYDTQYPGCNHQTAHYVMGWTDGEAKFPPKTDDWDGVSNPFLDWN